MESSLHPLTQDYYEKRLKKLINLCTRHQSIYHEHYALTAFNQLTDAYMQFLKKNPPKQIPSRPTRWQLLTVEIDDEKDQPYARKFRTLFTTLRNRVVKNTTDTTVIEETNLSEDDQQFISEWRKLDPDYTAEVICLTLKQRAVGMLPTPEIANIVAQGACSEPNSVFIAS